jgi:hypothetical protein
MFSIVYFFAFSLLGFLFTKKNISGFFSIALFATYGWLISLSRLQFETGDLPVYLEGFIGEVWDAYYLREPVFWWIGRTIYGITESPSITFLLFDLLLISLIIYAFKNNINFLLLTLICSFPVLLGFTNIYRQLLASAIIMVIFSIWNKSRAFSLLLGIVCCFVHYFSIIVLSIYIFVVTFRSRPILAVFFFSIIFLLASTNMQLINLFIDGVGGTDSRGGTGIYYVLIGLAIAIATWILIKDDNVSISIFHTILIVFLLGAVSLFFIADSNGTRLMMVAILLFQFLAARNLTVFKINKKKLVNYGFIAALTIVPLVISDSAWHLLFSYQIN